MKCVSILGLFIALFLCSVVSVSAQESEERLVDEVVAQVNDGVITLSRVKREAKSIVDSEVAEGKNREESQKKVDEKQGELIANLINEELLVQRAKEIGLDSEIEASINQRLTDIMKQNGVKTLESLYEQMRAQNIDPQELRDLWKKQATREMVIQREVQSKEYWRPTPSDIKAYYEKNKAKFTKPETISISELFLGFAGRDEAVVRTKAKQLVEQIRGGADFAKLVKENSDPGVVTQGAGKLENLKVSELVDTIKVPLADVKVGGITDPIEVKDLGMIILKVDAREKASNDSFFDERAVRTAMLQENYPDAVKKFFTELRSEAYIKINDNYRAQVAPVLYADERKDKQVSEK